MTDNTYNVIKPDNGVPIRAWTKGVPLDDAASQQLLNVAQLPFIYKWVAAMPDVHWGIGATVGSVIPTRGAIIPAVVGVDIGCGMMAVQTSLHANHLPDNLHGIRTGVPTTAARMTAARGRMPRHITRKCGRRWSLHTRRSSRSIPS
jgi:tRNA-splicing ligase RtcB (3'-phosphate/5'-hydroxy nucleic acid ligase)